MTRQNRVLPTGEIVADPHRGLFMGNRGILHDNAGELGTSRWKHPHWICCVLSFKGRQRQVMAPRQYTELFFLDEAVAIAAGHRPCAECRRADYTRWRDAWECAFGTRMSAPEMDRMLQRERVGRDRRQIRHRHVLAGLPGGVFVLKDNAPHLLHEDRLRPFQLSGYGPATSVDPHEEVDVLTPQVSVEILRAGYRPHLHPSAGA